MKIDINDRLMLMSLWKERRLQKHGTEENITVPVGMDRWINLAVAG
jgi:hypothetical protein